MRHQEKNFFNSLFSYLFKKLDINFFSYNKFFDNGMTFRLSNNNRWTNIYFEEGYYNDVEFYKHHFEKVPVNSEKAFLWVAQPTIKMYSALSKHDIGNGLSIYRKKNNYTEVFCFSPTIKNTEINHLYFNYFSNFKIFINLFDKNKYQFIDELECKKLIKTKINPSLYSYKEEMDYNKFFASLANEGEFLS